MRWSWPFDLLEGADVLVERPLVIACKLEGLVGLRHDVE
ncbi:Hypothetical protein LOCK919_0676 [Lacticaseibacillus paracasei]|nr:Hypothetical protein LOCK919_0676 [Lacticaseibacillus paracasei]